MYRKWSKVYRGKSKTTGTKVIIKSANVTNSEIGNNVKEYFNVERNVLSRRISCFSPQVYDYYSNETSIFMVESFIEGATLNEIKDLTVSELVKIIIKTARILNSYHENGLIHCDVKPKHIICQNGECFLIDYGAAKDMSEKTQGYIMGTEGYAAPEQKITYINESDLLKNETLGSGLGGRIDQRTDIFGLGRTLKRMMQIITCGDCELGNMTTGVLFNLEEQNGFEEDTSSNEEALKNDPEKDRFFIADPLLRAIADKMTAERKEDRFQSMLEVEEVLGDYLRLRSKNFDNNN